MSSRTIGGSSILILHTVLSSLSKSYFSSFSRLQGIFFVEPFIIPLRNNGLLYTMNLDINGTIIEEVLLDTTADGLIIDSSPCYHEDGNSENGICIHDV